MKVVIWIMSLVFILILILGSYYLYENYGGKSGEWKINWGLQVPQPFKLNVVYEIGGFQDYEGYHIVEYTDRELEKAKEFKLWNKITESNINLVSTRVESFKTGRINMNTSDDKKNEDYVQLFKNNPIEFDRDSLWYWKEKRKDHYFLAILNTKTKKLYVMERAF